MKLKNKLLPLTGVAAVAASVAPIALTSCSKSNTSEWFDFVNYKYSPSIEKHAYASMTIDEANAAYFGDQDEWLDEDEVAERFTQDYIWSASRLAQPYIDRVQEYIELSILTQKEALVKFDKLQSIPLSQTTGKLSSKEDEPKAEEENEPTLNSFKMRYNYVKAGHASVNRVVLGVEVPEEIPTISYQIEYESTLTSKTSSTKTVETNTGTLTVTDVPVKLYYGEIKVPGSKDSFDAWYIYSNEEVLYDLEMKPSSPTFTGKVPFSFVDDYQTNKSITKNGKTVTETSTNEDIYYAGMAWDDEDELYAFLDEHGMPSACSYYMLSVDHAAE